SSNKKFDVHSSINYNWGNSKLPVTDYAAFQILPPNLPEFYDTLGNLRWESGGVNFDNPMAYAFQEYSARSDNFLGNFQIGYEIFKGLRVRVNSGLNTTSLKERRTFPKGSQNPLFSSYGSANFANNRYRSWIVEPQVDFYKTLAAGKLSVLIGATWHKLENERLSIQASGYTNDQLLASLIGASEIKVDDGSSLYKY